jgi:hypothetical protein
MKAQAPDVSGDQVIAYAIKALRLGPLHNHLVKERPKTLTELGNLFDLRRPTFGPSYHGCIIIIIRSLQLKGSSCQQTNNAKHGFLIIRITYSHSASCLKSAKRLW